MPTVEKFLDSGIVFHWDRPPAEWPRAAEGELAMYTCRLDPEDLLRESDADPT